MRPQTLIAILVSLLGLQFSTRAETPFERDFMQLREQRDRALATASEPINRRYKESLDQLLRRATQANDLDTALKIRTELGVITVAPPATPPPPPPAKDKDAQPPQAVALTDLKLQLAGTKWKQVPSGTDLQFRDNTAVFRGNQAGTYKIQSKEKVSLTFAKKEATYVLSRDGRHLGTATGHTYELISAQ